MTRAAVGRRLGGLGRSLCPAVLAASLAIHPLRAAAPLPMADQLRGLVAEDLRVATVAWRLQTAGLAICERRQALSGLIVQHASQYGGAVRPEAATALNLHDLPTIVAVVPDSAADRAGIRAGDEIEALNGTSLLAGTGVKSSDRADDSLHDLIVGRLRQALNAGPVAISLRRDGRSLQIAFTGTAGCLSDIELDLRSGLNAEADGQTVVIWQGLLDFVQSDDELAFAIAHEMAHNILGHRDALRKGGGWLGDDDRVRMAEEQADYFGLYLIARAGYAMSAASTYMARYGRRTPALLMSADHPGGGTRAKALTAEAAEIDAKRRAGQPLRPDAMQR